MSRVKVIDKLEIFPVSEYILVKVDPDEDERTSGGIIIPAGALQNKKTQTGVIAKVGPGRRDPQGFERRIPVDCEVGDRIIFACYIGYPLVIKSEEYVLIKHNDIMGFIHEDFHHVDDEDGEIECDKQFV